jgi:hypothetical protein
MALGPDQRYSHVVPKKVLRFPTPTPPDAPEHGARLGSRVIVSLGGQRFAIDLYNKVTQLNPEPAPVVPMDRSKVRKRPRGEQPRSRTRSVSDGR